MKRKIVAIIVLLIIAVSLNDLGNTKPLGDKYKLYRDTIELGDSIMTTTGVNSPFGRFMSAWLTITADDTNSVCPDTFIVQGTNIYGDITTCALIDNKGYIDTMAVLDSNEVKKYLINESFLWNVSVTRTNTVDLDNRVSMALLEFSNEGGNWSIQDDDTIGSIGNIFNIESVDEVDFLDTLRIILLVDLIEAINLMDSLNVVGLVDLIEQINLMDSLSVVNWIQAVNLVDSLGVVGLIDVVTEITNGHIFVKDTNQYKFRDSYTLTSTGADTIYQDTLYGNFDVVYACYSDTGTVLDDSICVEIYDPLLGVWVPMGVKCLYNGNDYTVICPGGGDALMYEIGLGSVPAVLIDIIRFRMINVEVGVVGRTGELSLWGKANK